MRVLFLMNHAGATRNFESTLRGLAGRDHEIHLGFDRMEKKNLPGLWDLANELMDAYPNITAGPVPNPLLDEQSWLASRLRGSLDYMRFLGPEFDEAPKLRKRAERWAPESVRDAAQSRLRWRAMTFAFRRAERAMPINPAVTEYLQELRPDAVLVTPLLEPGSPQTEFIREANRMGIPTCLCVHSWDNLTNKGLIHELPDKVTVWNEMQADEAVEHHRVPRSHVAVTGASPYDHWFEWRPSRSREEFSRTVGLDPDRPFLLYLGSSGFIAPDEAGLIVEWLRELRACGLRDLQVLARPHPTNPLAGDSPSQRELASMGEVQLYPRAGANPTDEDRRKDYFDSLYYSSATTGINTTAFLEAAIVGRPVLAMLAGSYDDTQKGMLHFHHLLQAGGGLLQTADSYEDHAAQIREALAASHPQGCVSERSQAFTKAFIRPYGLDVAATPRMVEVVEALPDGPHRRGDRGGLLGRMFARRALKRVDSRRERAREDKLRRDRESKAARNEEKRLRAEIREEGLAAKAARQSAKAAKRDERGEQKPVDPTAKRRMKEAKRAQREAKAAKVADAESRRAEKARAAKKKRAKRAAKGVSVGDSGPAAPNGDTGNGNGSGTQPMTAAPPSNGTTAPRGTPGGREPASQ